MLRQFYGSKPALIAAAAFLVMGAEAASAASPDGLWLRPKTGAHVLAYTCGGGLGLKIIKSAKKETIGTVIMCNAKKVGPNKWQGDLKSTEDGRTYTGKVTLSGSKLELRGCAILGLICKTEEWSRVK